MSEVNVPLLRKAVEWAEQEAKKPRVDCRWNQGHYVVSHNTVAYSIALEMSIATDMTDEEYRQLVTDLTETCGSAYCIAGYVGQMIDPNFTDIDRYTDSNGVEHRVWNVAREALGISQMEADRLFSGGNSIQDVRRIAEEIAGETL